MDCRGRAELLVVTPGAEAEPGPCTRVHLLALPPAGSGVEGLRREVERLSPRKVVVAAGSASPEAAVYAALAAAAAAGPERVHVAGSGWAASLAREALRELGSKARAASSDEELLDLAAELLAGKPEGAPGAAASLLAPLASLAILLATLFTVFTLATGFPLNVLLEAAGLHGPAEALARYTPSGIIALAFEKAAALAAERLEGWAADAAVAVISGVGIVASLAPVVLLATAAVAALEDSGLLARAALGLQPLLRPLGLPGQAIYPLLLSTGCNVPGVLSAGSLPREARLAVAVAAPLVPCSARLAVIAAFSFAFLSSPLSQALAAAGVYTLALLLAGATAAAAYRLLGGPRLEVYTHLPPLRPPSPRAVYRASIAALRELLVRMSGPIALAAALLWLLAGGGHASPVGDALGSAAGRIFTLVDVDPGAAETLGVAAIAGATVKEVILEAIAVRVGTPDPREALATLSLKPSQAMAVLVFYTLYTPCIATAAAILAVTRSPKLLAATAAYTLALATAAMTLVYHVLEAADP